MVETAGMVVECAALEAIPHGARIALSGKSDRPSLKRLQEAVQGLLNAGKVRLLFECDGLEFLNSTALGYFINLADQVRGAGGAVALLRVPKPVRLVFDLLSLQDFFRFFEDEPGALQHLAHSAVAPEPEPAAEPEADRPAVIAALPSWLEDVDAPAAPPPLDHLRWNVLLQTVADRLGTGVVAGLCARAGVTVEGHLALVIRRLLKKLESAEALLGLFDDASLSKICGIYRLRASGRAAMAKELSSFVQRSSTEDLSRVLQAKLELEPLDFATLPVELTADNIARALENCPLPPRLRSEAAARQLLAKRLAKVFGEERVRAKRALGGEVAVEVDLEVAGRFGVFVAVGARLLSKAGAKERERLLGRIVVASLRYAPGGLFLVLAGGAPPPAELRALAEKAGARVVP